MRGHKFKYLGLLIYFSKYEVQVTIKYMAERIATVWKYIINRNFLADTIMKLSIFKKFCTNTWTNLFLVLSIKFIKLNTYVKLSEKNNKSYLEQIS